MNEYSLFHRLKTSIRDRGIRKSIIGAYSYFYDYMYDLKYGIDTHSWVDLDELDVNENQREHAVLYQATRVVPLKRLFKDLNLPKNHVFIDIGSGKGRVLLIAADYGFKKIKGIEFSKSLCAKAENNILRFRKKKKVATEIAIINIDAKDYQFEDDESVFFLFNPFDDIILKEVLDNIYISLKRHKRQIWMIYANAVHKNLIENTMNIVNSYSYNILEFDFMVYQVEPK